MDLNVGRLRCFLFMPQEVAPDPALSAVLRGLRKDRGLTQEALAFRAGITTGSLSRIELARAAPAWATVRSIARALNVGMGELGSAVEAESSS
jgi:transcriptional regulator with XRE-family HTH domain